MMSGTNKDDDGTELLIKTGLCNLVSMEKYGEYSCNYPNDLNIDNIKSSTVTFTMSISKDEYVNGTPDNRNYILSKKYGDIIKNFYIHEVNGPIHLDLVVDDKVWCSYSFPNYKGTLCWKPLSFGIPIVATFNSTVSLRILGKHKNFSVTYIYLATQERRAVMGRAIEYPGGFRTILGVASRISDSKEEELPAYSA